MFDFAVLIAFLIISKARAVRYTALAFVFFQLFYMLLVVPLSYEHYYHATALINLLVGMATYRWHKAFGIMAFTLIPVAYLGYILSVNYYTPAIYDTIAITITILQALTLCLRVIVENGYNRGVIGRALFRISNFNSFKLGSLTISKEDKTQ